MSTDRNKATARRWFDDIIVAKKLSVADEIFAPNHVINDPHAPPEGWPNGPAGLKAVATVLGGGFPDMQVAIEDQIAEGDRVVTRWSARGTHTQPLMGIPATGKPVRVTGANIARFSDGKIVESWFNFDLLTLLQQIGAVPSPGAAAH